MARLASYTLGQLENWVHVGRVAVEMYGDDGFGLWCNGLSGLPGIETPSLRLDVHQDGTGPGVQNRSGGGGEGLEIGLDSSPAARIGACNR